MNPYSKLQLAFFSIILLFTGYGIYSIVKMGEIGNSTVNIFNHPLTVSKATLQLNAHILKVSNTYIQVLTNPTDANIKVAIKDITKNQILIEEELKVINERYLGPEEDIENIKKLNASYFSDMEIFLTSDLSDESEPTNEKILRHNAYRKSLLESTQVVIDFASDKADQFLSNSINEKFSGQIISLLLLLVISVLMTFYIIRTLRDANKQTAQQLYLIDQNIPSCEVDKQGTIISVSNAFARTIRMNSADLIGQNSHFFIEDDSQRKAFLNTISTGQVSSEEIHRQIEDEIHWYEMKVSPKLSDEFDIQCYQIFFKDITSEKRIEEVSIRDSLTGLYNRNYFEEVFPLEVRKCKRRKKSFSALLLDVDFFKQFNDNYGHGEGDHALRAVASVIYERTQRPCDLAFRVGGEEFLIIFDADTEENVQQFCEQIRHQVESLKIPHHYSDVSQFLTVSIGACIFSPEHIPDESALYKKVDQQLYLAKSNGRNNTQIKSV